MFNMFLWVNIVNYSKYYMQMMKGGGKQGTMYTKMNDSATNH